MMTPVIHVPRHLALWHTDEFTDDRLITIWQNLYDSPERPVIYYDMSNLIDEVRRYVVSTVLFWDLNYIPADAKILLDLHEELQETSTGFYYHIQSIDSKNHWGPERKFVLQILIAMKEFNEAMTESRQKGPDQR